MFTKDFCSRFVKALDFFFFFFHNGKKGAKHGVKSWKCRLPAFLNFITMCSEVCLLEDVKTQDCGINWSNSLSLYSFKQSLFISADRAKQIKTTAKVNEDPTAALIRELQEENEKLKAMLASGKVDMSLLSEGGEDDDMTEDGEWKLRAIVA